MNTKERKQIVFEAIKNHPDNGKNQICDIVNAEYNASMSKPTCLKIIKLLIEEKKVGFVKSKNNKSVLTTNMTVLKLEKGALRSFAKAIYQLRKKLDHYEEHKKEFTDEQKTVLLTSAQRIVWILKWKVENDISKLEPSSEFKKLLQNLNEIDTELFSYFLEYPNYTKIWNLANKEYIREHFEMMGKIDSILESKQS